MGKKKHIPSQTILLSYHTIITVSINRRKIKSSGLFHAIFVIFVVRPLWFYFYFISSVRGASRRGDALPDFIFLCSFSCSEDHERDWPPYTVVFSGWQPDQYAECEKQQQPQ